ncbi:MAG: Gfo/Idh/MocA family protein [Candidatus Aminicenantales bacterium]
METVRYAIIGFGTIAENRIAKEGFACDRKRFKPLPGVELIGATDVRAERRKTAEALGLKWYESSEAVLADRSIDAVFIASDNATHFALGKKALQAQKHVILEKPMATNLAEARHLISLAAQNKLSLAVDHMMVHNAYNRKARELIAQGALGQVNDICLHMEFYYGSTPEEASAWRCANPSQLGGPIGDVGSHCLYMAEFLLASRIRAVAAAFTPPTLRIRVENGAFLRFRLENGLTGSARVSFNDPRGNLESTLLNFGYEVYGSKKTLRAYGTLFQLSGHPDEPVQLRLELEGNGKTQVLHLDPRDNIYQKVIQAHAESIRGDRRRMTGEDGIHNLRLVLNAYRSAASGGREIPTR